MSLPFFCALNPFSERSGINYTLAAPHPCQGQEMYDTFFVRNIYNAFQQDESILSALKSSFEVIMGCHYDLDIRGALNTRGSKGILDLLLFPLVARKLISDGLFGLSYLNIFSISMASGIGLILELTRWACGLLLFFALSPLVIAIHALKMFFRGEQLITIAPNLSNSKKLALLNIEAPDEYICPISLEIMTNPVYIKAHPQQRFEKAKLEEALSQKLENPLTREYLNHDGFAIDVKFRDEINDWVEKQLQNASYTQRPYSTIFEL
jgi:hypothetical protein